VLRHHLESAALLTVAMAHPYEDSGGWFGLENALHNMLGHAALAIGDELVGVSLHPLEIVAVHVKSDDLQSFLERDP
jgi:hypothetical protein